MPRVRHYTRVSSMQRILAEMRILARDRGCVFVEKASARKLSPADAEELYDLKPGRGNAYLEFFIEPELLRNDYNTRIRMKEWFIIGDVDLVGRDVEAFFNT